MFYQRLLLTISLILTSITAGVAQAQIESDGSVDTRVNSHQNLIEITGGQQRGDNLFHSFENFSVPKHIEAFFNNNPGIANIFSRVTGGNLSIIEGLIRANDANLILINPNGIIFSEGAQLQLGNGSFIGTTADSIVFKDGTEFSATDSGPPILTISTPIGLRWSNNPAGIQSQDATLEVEAGETIGLIGGNLILERTTITAPGGQIELGGLNEKGVVELNEDYSLTFPNGVEKGNISLSNGTLVNVQFHGGGDININAADLDISGWSRLKAGIASNNNSSEVMAGDIKINTTGNITINESYITNNVLGIGNGGNVIVKASGLVKLSGEDSSGNPSGIFSQVESSGVGNTGDVQISADSVEVINGAMISTFTYGKGDVGTIKINATGLLKLDGANSDGFPMGVASTVWQTGSGNGGNVEVIVDSLEIINGAFLDASTFGVGDAGNINIQASGRIKFEGEGEGKGFSGLGSGASSIVWETGSGNGGDIEIIAQSLEVLDGASISASTFGNGNGGSVRIKTTKVRFDGVSREVRGRLILDILPSGVFNDVNSNSQGNAGSVEIIADSVEVLNGAQIGVATFGVGDAGSVRIEATGKVKFDGVSTEGSRTITSSAFSDVGVRSQGNAGGIEIIADSVEVLNGAGISANTAGEGDAGTVVIDAQDLVRVEGGENASSFIASDLQPEAVGNGGGVEISADSVEVLNGGRIAATTFGEGDAGTVIIEAQGLVKVEGGSDLGPSFIGSDVALDAVGNAGGVEISADSVEVVNGGQIDAATFGQGDAGNIEINTSQLSIAEGGSIIAGTSSEGNAGSIIIKASESIELTGSGNRTQDETFPGEIAVSVQEQAIGDGGDITIDTPELQLSDAATITSNVLGIGKAGDININASSVFLSENSNITSSITEAAEAGGNITIDADSVIAFSNSDILAFSSNGLGGSITINSPAFFGEGYFGQSQGISDDRVDVNAEGQLSGGNVSTPDLTFIQNSLIEFSTTLLDLEQLIAGTCLAPSPRKRGRFVLSGNGGFPYTPGDIPTSDYPTARVRSTEPEETSVNVDNIQEIIEPSGFYTLENGQVILGRRCRC